MWVLGTGIIGDSLMKNFVGRKHECNYFNSILSDFLEECILRSLADSDAFQSGRCAEHNGRPETLAIIN